MRSALASLRAGGRLLLLGRPHQVRADEGPAVFFALCIADLLLGGVFASRVSAPPWQVSAEGILSWLAQVALLLAASWAVVRLAGRERLLWPVATWLAAALLVVHLILWSAGWALFSVLPQREAADITEILRWIVTAWWCLVALRLARHLGARWPQALLGAVCTVVLLDVSWHWLPQALPLRTVATLETNAGTADEGFDSISPEQVLYVQPQRLDEALGRLAPQRPGVVDLYVIAFAGDGTESVFRNEVEHVRRLFTERFDAAGRVLTLVNHPATLETTPLATLTNLTWAIDGVAAKMDPEEDILLVFLTSHGSEDHYLQVDLPPLPLDAIGPGQLAEALEAEPRPRWRVVIVSACYSGGFIDALRDEGTLVMTASRADRASFGCGADADITYFGRALLDEALNRTTSLPDAFALARESVARREHQEGAEPASEPQIATAAPIEARLARWQRQLRAGAPVHVDAAGVREARPQRAGAAGETDPAG